MGSSSLGETKSGLEHSDGCIRNRVAGLPAVATGFTKRDACCTGLKARNSVHFVNSDPEMMRYFVAFLRRSYSVVDEAFRLDCNLFADHADRQREIEEFWLDTLELPRSCLRRSTVNVYSKYSQKKRTNRLPYGTVRLCVHRTAIVQSIYGAIQEYGGFERPEWLG